MDTACRLLSMQARLELLRAQTDLILALHWHQVERVARALME